MSSRDRQNQYDSYRRDDGYEEDAQFDDVFIDESWSDDPYNDPAPPPRRSSSPPRDSRTGPSRPVIETAGTAVQLDRLQRAMRRPGQSAPQQASQPSRSSRPAPGWRPDRPVPPQSTTGWSDEDDEPYDPQPARRTSQATRRSSSYQPDPYVDENAGWDDEYYGDYEDDFSEYDDPRPAPRQRPQITMPSISRPSLPPAIANAALIGDRIALGTIGIAAIGLIAMAILVANQVDSLAPGFATHVSASGVREDIRSESALWNLPIMATMLTLMAIVIAWFTAPIDRFASRFALGAAILVQFVTWVALIRLI